MYRYQKFLDEYRHDYEKVVQHSTELCGLSFETMHLNEKRKQNQLASENETERTLKDKFRINTFFMICQIRPNDKS